MSVLTVWETLGESLGITRSQKPHFLPVFYFFPAQGTCPSCRLVPLTVSPKFSKKSFQAWKQKAHFTCRLGGGITEGITGETVGKRWIIVFHAIPHGPLDPCWRMGVIHSLMALLPSLGAGSPFSPLRRPLRGGALVFCAGFTGRLGAWLEVAAGFGNVAEPRSSSPARVAPRRSRRPSRRYRARSRARATQSAGPRCCSLVPRPGCRPSGRTS